MKDIFIFCLILCFTTSSFAQISETKRMMSQGNNNAITLEVANAGDNLISDVWKNFIKDNYKGKTKYDRREKEHITDDIDIPSLGQGNTIDMYVSIEEKGSDATFYLWCDLGGAYLSSKEHPNRFDAAETMLLRFGLEIEKEKLRLEIEEEEKNLKKMEGDLRKLENDNDRYHKIIEKAKKEIQEAEDDISKNLQEQEMAKDKIRAQEDVVEQLRQKLKNT